MTARSFVRLVAVLCFALGWVRLAGGAPSRAIVFAADPSEPSHAFMRELAGEVSAAGYDTVFFDQTALARADFFRTNQFDLVVLANARQLPAQAAPALEEHLKRGGDLLALGLPAWEEARFEIGGRWLSRAEYEQAIAAQKPQAVIENFEQADLKKWSRATNDRESGARHEWVADGGSRALHVVIENFTGWETFSSPVLSGPFATNHTLTCFRARGGPRTRQLALEWTEQDGSRWIATVDLTPEWKQYALPPEAFKPWQPPVGRGSKPDRLNVDKAVRFVVGLAQTHTVVEGDQHEYWFDDLGTSPHPYGVAVMPDVTSFPRFETFSPSYLFFPVTGPVKLSTPAGLPVEATVEIATPHSSLLALHPRPRGIGFGQERPWRWEPLLAARAADGDYRGAIATLLVNVAAPFRGGVWASFTLAEPEFYRQPAIKRLLREVLGGMRRGVYQVEGGSEFFTAFEAQSFRLGARVVNFGQETPGNLRVRLRVTTTANGTEVHAKEWPLDLPADTEQTVEETWKPERWPAGGFEVTTELLANGKVIDRLRHELQVWRPKAQPRFIEARDGGFRLDGKPWKAHGVNYLPSSGIGVADNQFFEHWLGRGAYDPEVIERDLRRIRAMGMNAVSVFVYHQSLRGHLLDFLRRCEALGLRVNQSLRPGTPMDFRWNQMKELIDFFRLAENDTVFAYDLAWEPSHFDHDYQQKHYAKLWGEWVLKRYGSVEAAERSWGVPAPSISNLKSQISNLPVPQMSQLTRDGPWRKVAADYRAFLDELLRERYAEARRLVKSIDPHHPVSFRMQFAGDPTHNSERLLPYDFYGLADAVDIWEPEAYGRVGDWEKVKPGHFTAAYARLCDPVKPVLWAEMGYSVWDMKLMAPHPEKLKFAARYYADFYRMLRESGADGVFFWWYPGGFRLNENSDYGVINPDGTDRKLTRIIREEGTRFLSAPKPPLSNRFIAVDRDRDARGLPGIYEAVKAEYWRALSEGKQPALKWATKPAAGQPFTPRDEPSP